ncbi:MAG: hypothetical protein UX57_C0001G0018 [Candidatus Uhrbacteria bacterium GW2011_GWE2_46_68]|uniref:DUF11 domain-containing protein n=2 Tax=Candidatus Uhriibacteriota TaxID=1752732 RepID=A0A0G1Q9Y3_9BACT|nr:MAG: hypothetical protein UX45_C0002G0019 [Candidatus Uhrbacteria bacterium GW2011_GWF2_46_218]KKU41794.1 MAG: hypothetical protein UX57_C0001G0018 [Candidatus Uhrbacteria bacterium GW2011_GWE2_46_68]
MSFFHRLKPHLVCHDLGTPEHLLHKTISLVIHPGRLALLPFVKWFEKHYAGRYAFARTIFLADLVLIGLTLGLLVAAGILTFFPKHTIADDLYLDVSIAPEEIVSGAPSTLIIHYTNGTGEELRNANITLTYPAHFQLQEILSENAAVEENHVILGTLKPEATGSIKITGVLFGDVGGTQTFRSLMTFSYGEKNKVAQKTSEHRFSPVRSTLALTLWIPEPLVAYQAIEGTITYHNTGTVDFPEISIEPSWPEGFVLIESQPSLVDNHFTLPSIIAGEQGTMSFSGYLATTKEEVVFSLHPSFTFEQTHYRQEVLTQTCAVIPPQLSLTQIVDRKTVRPGSEMKITIAYENTGDATIYDVRIGVQSNSPFVSQKNILIDKDDAIDLDEITPGQKGEVILSTRLRSSVSVSELSRYENISIDTTPLTTYRLGSMDGQEIAYTGTSLSTILTTPLVLESFARYALPSGDQLGRGPLPPRVGQETKYWIFWHLSGTTNPLSQVTIEGTLPPYVSFTGRQTVSQDEGVTYNPALQTVSWTSHFVQPTLDPQSAVVGIAFEVSLIPTEEQIGTSPILLSDIQITALDQTTGAFVSATSAAITTDLPEDIMASEKGVVE